MHSKCFSSLGSVSPHNPPHNKFGAEPDIPALVTCKVTSQCSWVALDYGSMFDTGAAFTVYWWARGGGHLTALSSPGESCFSSMGKYLYYMTGPTTSGYFTATSNPEYGRWIMKAVSSGPNGATFCIDGDCRTQSTPIHCPFGIHGLLFGQLQFSPIVIVPGQMPQGALHKLFYSERDHYDFSIGQGNTDTQMMKATQITIAPFPLNTFLVAPPIIVQTRKMEKTCSSFTTDYSENMLSELATAKCGEQYTCDGPQAWLPCWGDSDADSEMWESWALHRVEFHGLKAYPEFLYSLDNAVLMRNGRQLKNSDFIDSGTKSAELVAVFSTPNLHMTSVLLITADLDGNGVSTRVEMRHWLSLEEAILARYMMVSLLAIGLGVLMMVLEFRDMRWEMRLASVGGSRWSKDVLVAAAQLLFSCGQTVFIFFRMFVAVEGKHNREQAVGPLYQMPWLDPMEVWRKQNQLFGILNELLVLIDTFATNESIAFFILCLLFLRMPMYQMLHVRVASFPMTMGIALEELVHFLITCIPLFLLLAGLAHWSFGATDANFSTLMRASDTQLKMLTGEFPFAEGNESMTKFIYYVMYIGTFFFILVNFLLAIIVDSYEANKDAVKGNSQSGNFLVDTARCLWQHGKAHRYGWPKLGHLLYDLRKLVVDDRLLLTKADFLALPSVARCKQGAGTTFWFYYTETYNLFATEETNDSKNEKEPDNRGDSEGVGGFPAIVEAVPGGEQGIEHSGNRSTEDLLRYILRRR